MLEFIMFIVESFVVMYHKEPIMIWVIVISFIVYAQLAQIAVYEVKRYLSNRGNV